MLMFRGLRGTHRTAYPLAGFVIVGFLQFDERIGIGAGVLSNGLCFFRVGGCLREPASQPVGGDLVSVWSWTQFGLIIVGDINAMWFWQRQMVKLRL